MRVFGTAGRFFSVALAGVNGWFFWRQFSSQYYSEFFGSGFYVYIAVLELVFVGVPLFCIWAGPYVGQVVQGQGGQHLQEFMKFVGWGSLVTEAVLLIFLKGYMMRLWDVYQMFN